MKNLTLVFLVFFPLVLLAQENTKKNQISLGLKAWNEIDEQNRIQLLGDSMRNFTEHKTTGFSGLTPYIEIRKNELRTFQLGISEFSLHKEVYDDYNQKYDIVRNDSFKFSGRDYKSGFEEIRYAFEAFGVYKITTAKKYLPSLFLQASLGFDKRQVRSVFSQIMPYSTFEISSTFITGFEYSLNLSNKLSLDFGVQTAISKIYFKTDRIENPMYSLRMQRTLQVGISTSDALIPAFRIGISYKMKE